MDLAGSERLDRSGAGNDAQRLRETQAINKSLSCLADVFSALSAKASHVPFRNSKLTYLMQVGVVVGWCSAVLVFLLRRIVYSVRVPTGLCTVYSVCEMLLGF